MYRTQNHIFAETHQTNKTKQLIKQTPKVKRLTLTDNQMTQKTQVLKRIQTKFKSEDQTESGNHQASLMTSSLGLFGVLLRRNEG